MRLLIAEHDPALGQFLERSFLKEGYTLTVVQHGDAAVQAIAAGDYDLLLLDLDLPDQAGMGVLEAARQLGNGMRVLVLASGAGELDLRLACYGAGADDCLAKPFAIRELKARCQVLARRHDAIPRLRCGALELNRLDQTLASEQGDVSLSRREFGLLEFLMLHRGRCVSRATLLEHVWSTGEGGNPNVVDVYINYLRRKLGANGVLIETVRGQGYRIASPQMGRPSLPVPLPMLPAAFHTGYQQAVS